MTNALTIIRWEHHSIESVLHALGYFVDQMWAGKRAPENKVFRAMLQYIDLFAEHLHHPKEDRHLFRRLRLRTHRADDLLAEEVLTDDDWREIDAAFSGQGDFEVSPQTKRDLEKLFDHILSITPAPIGAAPELAGAFHAFRPHG